jgi:RHS repeat-associated protein
MKKKLQSLTLLCALVWLPFFTASSQNPCNPTLANGLTVRLPFNEQSGTVAADASGNNVSGQVSSGAIWQPAEGIDQQGALELPGGTLMMLPLSWQPTAFTVSWWVKPLYLYNNNLLVGNTWGGFAFHSSAGGTVYVGTDLAGRMELNQNIVQLNTWQHFVFTFNGGVGKFYKNGQLLATKGGMAPPSYWGNFMISGSHDASSSTPGALYDEFRMYNRAVTDQEAQDLFSCRPNPCSATGTILLEHWSNIPGTSVSDLPLQTSPTNTSQLTSLEIPANVDDNYGTRIRGYVCPPTTGTYTFLIAGDDQSQLWLSSDDNPATKAQIASVPEWTDYREFTRFTEQQSAPIYLVAGRRYYLEVLHKEGDGGDNLTVAWDLPGGGRETPIDGSHLSPYEVVCPVIPLQVTATPTTIEAGESTALQVKSTLFGNALTFNGSQQVNIPGLLASVTNNFTIEAWVSPTAAHEIDPEGTAMIGGVYNQKYLVFPILGNHFGEEARHAGVGLSVGTNGVSVYEHSGNYMPAVLVWQHALTGWNHIAVVYENRQPKLYVNGVLVKVGLNPLTLPNARTDAHPSLGFGGGAYGWYEGSADEVKIWRTARTPAQLAQSLAGPLTTLPTDLVGYWRLDEGQGTMISEATGAYAPVAITGSPTPTWQVPSTVAIPGIRYEWSPAAGLSATTGTTVVATPAQTTSYTVTATTDAGCSGQATTRITVNGTPLPPSDPSDDRNRNWTLERSFDDNGNVIGEGKQFFDALGRPTQSQTKNMARKHVFASQTIYNSTGEPVLSTLAAPTNNQEFKYKEGFITAGDTPYSADNFENGKADSPDPVDAATVPGTLGYYYSENNTLEPYTAATQYPFSLQESYKGPLGGTRRAAGPGDEVRMGQGHEVKRREVPLLDELTHYMNLRPLFVPSNENATLFTTGAALYRLNAGGNQSGDFTADQYFTGGDTYGISSTIAGTSNQALYQSERYGAFSYKLPVSNGQYTVVLHFAEIYWTESGQRVFNVAAEGTTVLSNYDIVRKVGPLTATSETFTVAVSDGELTLDFLAGAAGASDPKISAIEISGVGSSVVSLRRQGLKSVSLDINGRESISLLDKDGQLLATCLSGAQYPGVFTGGAVDANTGNAADIPLYLDVHIPAAGATEIYFTGTGSVRIRDIYSGAETTHTTPARITKDPGFYRIQSLEGSHSFNYLARYGNFSYSYYDDAGRVVATIAPNGISTATTPATATPGPNTVRNASFEEDGAFTYSPKEWQATGTAGASFAETFAGGHTGTYHGTQYSNSSSYAVTTHQIVPNLPNGLYTLRAWVKGSGGQVKAHMFARDYGGALQTITVPATPNSTAGPWRMLEIRDLAVTNGQCDVGFESEATAYQFIYFDDVELFRQSSGNPLQFVTRTTYSADNKVLSTSSPDEGTSEYVYARDGRIRFSQNALQKQQGRFSYTNYDEVERAVESGEYTMAADPAQGIRFENHLTATPATNSVLNILEDRTREGGLDVARCGQRNQVWYDLSKLEETGTAEPQLNSRVQEFVLGGVAKTQKTTQNEVLTTWYSYDELGRLTWMVQEAPVIGVKTVDYTYDFNGNVLEVAYQKGQPDAFYHHYRYDANQRLMTVHTSVDGQPQTLQAKYVYYLHGPLKRVELANHLQGVDYTYTVQGWLKSINHVEQRRDPGQDAPRANGVPKDLFSLTLDYFAGDYRSQPLPTITPQVIGNPEVRYDGTVRDVAWRTAASRDRHLHTFHYDDKTQLLKADYHKLGITGLSYQAQDHAPGLEPYQEGNLSYDLNGNLGSMRRTDGMGGYTDNFAYQYTPGTNKLAAVHGQGSPTGPVVLDYDYDVTGQMTRQRDEQGQRYLQYDVTGKVTGVYKDQSFTQPLVTFTYDDRGFRARKASYAPATGQLVRTTYYVRDQAGNELSTYEQEAAPGSALQRTEVPLYGNSRVGVLVRQNDGTLDARYELNDQLGNARVVFHRPTTTTYLATMAPGQAQREEQEFTNLPATRFATPVASDGYVARLHAAQNVRQGPGKTLTVEKGDTITLSAMAYFQADGSGRTALRAAPLLLAGATAQPQNVEARRSELPAARSTRRGWLGRLAAGFAFTGWAARQPTPPTSGVIAYLRYQFKDAQGNVLDEQYEPVNPATPDAWQSLQLGIRAAQAGTLELSVISEDPARVVYFDDIKVEQTGSTILQEQHTYAYGVPLTGLNYVIGNKRYRHGYQGQFAEKDEETGWESFELRLYNSRIGRWTSYDPYGQFHSPYVGMGNNPVSGTDPDGGFCCGGGGGVVLSGGMLSNVTVTASRAAGAVAPIALKTLSVVMSGVNAYGEYAAGFINTMLPESLVGYQSEMSGAYGNGQLVAHGVKGVTGALLSAGGGLIAGGGLTVTAGTGTLSSAVSVPLTLGGLAIAGAGGSLMSDSFGRAKLNMSKRANGNGSGNKELSASEKRSVASLRQQIAVHKQKLKEYLSDPDKFDNKGFLKNAPNDQIRQRIIDSRARHLESEIKTFEDNIKKILNN